MSEVPNDSTSHPTASDPGPRGAEENPREMLLMQLERRWPREEDVADTPAEGPVRIGPYRVDRELGRGGFGVVLLAHDERHDRQVALKVPRPEVLGNAAVRERFIREAEAVAEMVHPHVVKVYEIGKVGPIDYIASEYCPQGSLADLLAQGKAELSPRQSAVLVQRLAEAVQHIHDQGLLHRDLKPSNVMLADANDDAADQELSFRPMVTDFGLAKLVDQSYYETGSSVMLGTPLYMSPEQAACEQHRIGPWTDVYSLGVILYELLMGRAPFVGPGLVAVLMQLQSSEPVPPRRERPELPKPLETICLKCLAKDPSERYPSAAALADDLGRYLAGEKLVARRPNIADKFLKWSRHPHRITEAGILATVVNAVLTVWLLLEIPYVIMDPGHVDGVAVAASAAALITFFSMPLMVIGIFTLRGHHWGPWAGLVLSSVNFLISLLGMFNIVELFGNLYDATPVLRGVMFGLTSTLVGGELLYFAVACLASEKRRKSQRVVTSASTPWNG